MTQNLSISAESDVTSKTAAMVWPHACLGYYAGRAALWRDGRVETISTAALREIWGSEALILVNAPLIAKRLFAGRPHRSAAHLDALELFAFVRPAAFCAPSGLGLSQALGVDAKDDAASLAAALAQSVGVLKSNLESANLPFRLFALSGIKAAEAAKWPWADLLSQWMAATEAPSGYVMPHALSVWALLEEWEDQAPRGAARSIGLIESDVDKRLDNALSQGRLNEERPEQRRFAQTARRIFEPKFMLDQPNMWLLEAGTGVGKTLGYLAPAAEWAERADTSIWISTYTRALQKQIERDARNLYDSAADADQRIAVRKGRENYLCLLNYQDSLAQIPPQGPNSVLAMLLARWVVYSRDGDLMGGDFPGWVWGLFQGSLDRTLTPSGLIDRRGECIHSACAHYRVCFVEKAVRKSQSADIVIANHALVMAQAAFDHHDRLRAGADIETETASLSRIIFDEAHHVFDAADSAFSARLSGYEAFEMRRWLRGTEGTRRRSRGLDARLGDLLSGDEAARKALDNVMFRAAALTSDGWAGRLFSPIDQAAGPIEAILRAARDQIELRQDGKSASGIRGAGLTEAESEIEAHPPLESVTLTAAKALEALKALKSALKGLIRAIEDLQGREDALDASESVRLDGIVRGIRRRVDFDLPGWIGLVQDLAHPESRTDADCFVDRFCLERQEGRGQDVALTRHYVDPGQPFADLVLKPAHGILMASASLTDGAVTVPEDVNKAFALAQRRSGAEHLIMKAKTLAISSPFDYAAQARLFVISDVPKDDARAVASAMGQLFIATGGGGLGLFTAISRLKTAFAPLQETLSREGLSLYAQHVDPLEVSDLISIFRSEVHACLLGTDAVRDGIDIPGEALRLICFDRVPWPRPDLVHKARRQLFGRSYDDALARARLAQAFGRLIRKADDRGVFVMLDAAAPTRLFASLPPGVVVQRCSLAEAVAASRDFLKS